MAYSTTGYDTCTVRFPLFNSVLADNKTYLFFICAIEEEARRNEFDIYYHWLRCTTEAQRQILAKDYVGTYTRTESSDSNIVTGSYSLTSPYYITKDITVSDSAVRSYNPIIISVFNPRFRNMWFPYILEKELKRSIPMTEKIAIDDAVTAVDFMAETTTDSAFLKEISHKFLSDNYNIENTYIPIVGTSYDNFFNESFGSEGMRIRLNTSECVQDVDLSERPDESYGWRFVDGKASFLYDIQRQKFGLQKNRDGGWLRIPVQIPGTDVTGESFASAKVQTLWKYHYSLFTEKIDVNYYEVENLTDSFRKDNFGYMHRHNTNLTGSQGSTLCLKIAVMDLKKRTYFFIDGRYSNESLSGDCFFRNGAKIRNFEVVSENEVRYNITKIKPGDYKIQPAGYRSSTGIVQPGKMIISKEGEALRQNKGVTI